MLEAPQHAESFKVFPSQTSLPALPPSEVLWKLGRNDANEEKSEL